MRWGRLAQTGDDQRDMWRKPPGKLKPNQFRYVVELASIVDFGRAK
jgi:hypothetical protein